MSSEPPYDLLPGEQTYRGRGADLHAALDDAWKRAKCEHGAQPGVYRVVEILVVTTNPISEYRVAIGPVG